MSMLYVSDPDTKIGIEENRIIAEYKDGTRHSLPIENMEGITLLTKAHISTNCMEACLYRGIPVSFFSKRGRYFGRLVSTGHVDAPLQRMQSALYDTGFSLELARRIIRAKVKNQLVVLRRYAKSKKISIQDLDMMLLLYRGRKERRPERMFPACIMTRNKCNDLFFPPFTFTFVLQTGYCKSKNSVLY